MQKKRIFILCWKYKLIFALICRFNTVLMETGLVLLHPLLQEKRRMPLPPIKQPPSKVERKKLVAPFVWMCQRHPRPELPKSLDGIKMPIIGSLEFEQMDSPLEPVSQSYGIICFFCKI